MKKVLITGANRGLGLGFVQHYLLSGNLVVATCRRPEKAKLLHNLLEKYPDQLRLEALDVSDESAFHALANRMKESQMTFDMVVNNAGISLDESLGSWTEKTFSDSFLINVTGPALLVQSMIPFLKEGTKIIQISSGRGSINENQGGMDGLDAYGISKAALNMLTRRLATKFKANKITVIALNPGWVQTDMGGPTATLTIHEAIQKMTKTIDQISLKNTGQFLENDGTIIAW